MNKSPYIMTKAPLIITKVPHVMTRVPHIVKEAPHIVTIDQFRQSWHSIALGPNNFMRILSSKA